MLGVITVLRGTIKILFLLCVVPSVNVTDFPLASFTTCTSSLHLFCGKNVNGTGFRNAFVGYTDTFFLLLVIMEIQIHRIH